MRQQFVERILVALICARLVAGCGATTQPAPAPQVAAPTEAAAGSTETAAVPASLDLCRLPDLPPAGILSRSGYTQLDVAVTDSSGAPIAGLSKTDFIARSGAKPAAITYFRQESRLTTPVSLVIVGDVSESMYRKTVVLSADELAKVRNGLNQAATQLNDCDEVAVVLIGGTYRRTTQAPPGPVTLAQSFTTNHSLALSKMYSVLPSGQKLLSGGLRLGVETLSGAHYPNRALILMTDGLDKAALDQSASLLAQVRQSGVSFWVIGIGDPEARPGILSKLRGDTGVDVEAVKKLAADGGGWALFAKPVESDEGASLAAAVTTINQQLGDGYAIGIDASPGTTAPTVALVNHPDAVVRADLVPSAVLAEAAKRPAKPGREVGTAKEVVAPEKIRDLAGYTEVAATVVKPDGSYIDGLSKRDFSLSVDGASQPIDFFDAGQEAPATVGILVDTSGSMTPKLPQARAAIEKFVKALDPGDQVFLFAFSSKTYLLQALTTDHDALIQRLDLLHAYGQTAMFDAVLAGISEAQQSRNQTKV
ncbi:MAG TPA: VWA domain-containing protein, partial [Patescibacteria group bacterium]|nr:VWA domain-containing protein [Patescibacteria group bacterium]